MLPVVAIRLVAVERVDEFGEPDLDQGAEVCVPSLRLAGHVATGFHGDDDCYRWRCMEDLGGQFPAPDA